MKKLVGSTTSPYVRRIRLQMFGEEYDFEVVKVFTEEGQKVIAQYSNTRRIPLLVEDDQVIWDSMLIAEYLAGGLLPLEVKKDLVLINEMTDAGVQVFQLRMFKIDPDDKGQFSVNHIKRIFQILDYFEDKVPQDWDLVGQWLYCTLDWLALREIVDWKDEYPLLAAFVKNHSEQEDVKQTDPRDAP